MGWGGGGVGWFAQSFSCQTQPLCCVGVVVLTILIYPSTNCQQQSVNIDKHSCTPDGSVYLRWLDLIGSFIFSSLKVENVQVLYKHGKIFDNTEVRGSPIFDG